jgi:hypothetical protein
MCCSPNAATRSCQLRCTKSASIKKRPRRPAAWAEADTLEAVMERPPRVGSAAVVLAAPDSVALVALAALGGLEHLAVAIAVDLVGAALGAVDLAEVGSVAASVVACQAVPAA